MPSRCTEFRPLPHDAEACSRDHGSKRYRRSAAYAWRSAPPLYRPYQRAKFLDRPPMAIAVSVRDDERRAFERCQSPCSLLDPLRAHLVARTDDCPWSSVRAQLGAAPMGVQGSPPYWKKWGPFSAFLGEAFDEVARMHRSAVPRPGMPRRVARLDQEIGTRLRRPPRATQAQSKTSESSRPSTTKTYLVNCHRNYPNCVTKQIDKRSQTVI